MLDHIAEDVTNLAGTLPVGEPCTLLYNARIGGRLVTVSVQVTVR